MHQRLIAAIAALVFVLPAVAPAQHPAPESLAPQGTAVFLKIGDPAAFRSYLDGTNEIFKMDFVQKMLASAKINPERLRSQFKKETGLELSEILEVLEGPAGVAVAPNPTGGMDKPNFMFVLGVKEGEKTKAIWDSLQKKIIEKAGENIGANEDVQINGAMVWHGEIKKTSRSDHVWATLGKGAFTVSNDKSLIESATLGLSGKETSSLAKNADFGMAMKKLGNANQFAAYVDIGVILELTKGMRNAKDNKIMAALGVDKVRSAGLGLDINDRGIDLAGFLLAPGKRTGVLKILSPEVGTIDSDHIMMAGSPSASMLWFDFAGLLGNVRDIMEAMGQNSEMIDEGLTSLQDSMGIDIQADLLALLKPPFCSVELPVVDSGSQADLSGMKRSLMYTRSSDPKKILETVKTLLNSFAGMIGVEMEEQTVLGNKVLHLSMDAGDAGEAPDISICASDTHFMVSMGGNALLERALTLSKDTPSLFTTPDWKRAMAGFPEKGWIVGYYKVENLIKNLKPGLEQLSMFLQLPEAILNMDPKAIAAMYDLIGMSVSSDANGLQLGVRLSRPPAKPVTQPK